MNRKDGGAPTPGTVRRQFSWVCAFVVLGMVASSAFFWAMPVLTFHHPGVTGTKYHGPGTDFMVFHLAVDLARSGNATALYDGKVLTGLLNQRYGSYLSDPLPFRAWLYPPTFLVVLLPFCLAPFLVAYGLFQLVTGIAMTRALAVASKSGRIWVAIAAGASPAAALAFVYGQCAFLIVALMATGAALLRKRPLVAGALLGALTVKPQFALLVPFIFAARRDWRSAVAAVACAVCLAALSLILFDGRLWTDWLFSFVRGASGADVSWDHYGRMWGYSVFACATALGAGPLAANVCQLCACAVGAASVYLAFSRSISPPLGAAVLLSAGLLAAPQAGYYDVVMLAGAAMLFLGASEARAPDLLLTFAIWVAPLIGLPTQSPFAVIVPILSVALIMRALGLERDLRPAVHPTQTSPTS